MNINDYTFDLPQELIAKVPAAKRSQSRLLCFDPQAQAIKHQQFLHFPELLQPGDLLVLNNTKVIPARLYGSKITGGKIELLIERVISEHDALAHIKASKSPKIGSELILHDGIRAIVTARSDDLFHLRFLDDRNVFTILDAIGEMPLPPYIDREVVAEDSSRYQTVYAKHQGAVAAPTAGLHFEDSVFSELATRGINTAYITLHVGAGTFQPVRVDNILDHKMHKEYIEVPATVCDQIKATKARGNKVVAVGTTTVRSLETAALGGELQAFAGDTDIFIYPGFEFQVVDALLTNFHLPQSTLLMLISALAGRENILHAYQEAIAERYRFYSYGDAMFIANRLV